MKKLILLLSILLLVGCSSNKNRGYGYNTKSEIPSQTEVPAQVDTNSSGYHKPKEKKSFWEKAAENQDARVMTLYNKHGNVETWDEVRAYKGQFDDHTFYVFISSEGLVVIPETVDMK